MTSTDSEHVVIVGGGQGASEMAAQLRMLKHSGPVTIVSDESHAPYQRPPLSKAFLAGQADLNDVVCRPLETYESAAIGLILESHVSSIDRDAHRIELLDGGMIPYDRLVIATGGRPRRLVDADDVYKASNAHELRTLADAVRLRQSLHSGRRMTIIGGGYIGLEVAAMASRAGLEVTVLEALPRLLARVTSRVVSDFYESVHRSMGVAVRTETRVTGFAYSSDGTVVGVVCDDGSTVATDLLLIGIGMIPNTELAEESGLAADDGIVVDEHLATADADVFAIGDCASYLSIHAGRRVRLESVPNVIEQARSVAATLVGSPRPYSAAPWFWSDQYDLKLQTVGLHQDHDTLVLRGDPTDRSFLVVYLRNGRIIAADAISRPREFTQARKLVSIGAEVDPDAIADDTSPLARVLQSNLTP